jgi:hypothetical protein
MDAGFTNSLHLGRDALQNEFSQELLEDNHRDKRYREGKTRFATVEHTKAPLANSESETWGENVETGCALRAFGGRLQLILQLH